MEDGANLPEVATRTVASFRAMPDTRQQAEMFVRVARTAAKAPEPYRVNEMIEQFGKTDPYALDAALKIHQRKSNFFPTVAELRAIVCQNRIMIIPECADAWGEVRRTVTNKGRYRYPEAWSHPLIGRVCTREFYTDICNAESDQISTFEAHFLRMYDALRKSAINEIVEGREDFAPQQAALPPAQLPAPKLRKM